MDKNSVIGFVLIGLIMVGFTFYQSKQAKQAMEIQRQLDSAAAVQALIKQKADSVRQAELTQQVATQIVSMKEEKKSVTPTYQDASLERASKLEGKLITLSNDKLEFVVNTKGAQPYSVLVKDYVTYDSTALYLVQPNKAQLGISVYTGETINTKDFVFEVVEQSDSLLRLRLPFSDGGYIEQRYLLTKGSYMVSDTLSFVGMEGLIPRKVNNFDIEWTNVIRICGVLLMQIPWPNSFHIAHDYIFKVFFYLVIFLMWVLWVEKFYNPSLKAKQHE